MDVEAARRTGCRLKVIPGAFGPAELDAGAMPAVAGQAGAIGVRRLSSPEDPWGVQGGRG